VSLGIVVLVSVIIFPCDIAAQTLDTINENERTLSGNISPHFNVGKNPRAILVDDDTNKVYVANSDSNNVSMIDIKTMKVSNIRVGENPVDIDHIGQEFYVANSGSHSISVIDGNTLNVTHTIPVGHSPVGILAVGNKVYVANSGSNSISVIDRNTMKATANISAGANPDISINHLTKIIYVAYEIYGSTSTVSSGAVIAIYGKTDKVLVGATFNANPFNAGRIKCINIEAPTNQYFYVGSDTNCIAEPSKGFQFSSWVENLEGNSTRTVSASLSDSPLDRLLRFIHIIPEDNSTLLNVNHYGIFTANFKESPPPLPPEYWGTLFGVIVTSLVATLFIPTITGWMKAKRQHRSLSHFKNSIDSLNNSGDVDQNNNNEDLNKLKKGIVYTPSTGNQNISHTSDLDDVKTRVTDAYTKGKINELQYGILKDEVTQKYEERFTKIISVLETESLYQSNDEYIYNLDRIKREITDAHIKGKITDLQHKILDKILSTCFQYIFNKKIDSLNGKLDQKHGANTQDLESIKNDITYAYAEGKINELHYNLLNQKISDYQKKTGIY
jgi:YVTN family beta-propeller protein